MAKIQEEEKAKFCQPSLGGMFASALAVILGIFVHTFLRSATPAFFAYGIVWALLGSLSLAVLLVPALLILYFLLKWIRRIRDLPSWLNNRNLFPLGLACLFFGIVAGLYGTIPKVRYRSHIGTALSEVSEVKVAGFDSFLARRWLFSFKISPQGCEKIVSDLNLQQKSAGEPVGSLQEDMFFKDTKVPWLATLPRPEDSKTFVGTSDVGLSAGAWITFVYDPKTGNAWLYKGYQN